MDIYNIFKGKVRNHLLPSLLDQRSLEPRGASPIQKGNISVIPPLCICNKEEKITDSEIIRVGGWVEKDINKEMSEEEVEVSATLPGRASISRILTTHSQIKGVSLRALISK